MVQARRLAAALVAAALLVTAAGCAGLYPGAAAQVGDTTITRSRVEDLTRIQCDLASGASGAQASPRSQMAQRSLDVLVESAVNDAYGKSRNAGYDTTTLRTQVQQFSDQLTKLSARDKAVILGEFRAYVKGQLMLAEIGAKALQAKGTAKPSVSQSVNEGTKLAKAWAKTHLLVEIDPRYNPGRSGEAGGGDGSVSRPVSSYAKAAAGKPSAAFVGALPPTMRCG